MISEEQLREMRCERHTERVEKILHDSSVAVAGLGGLGSHVAFALTRVGVGKLILIDFDTVDISNLNRQEYRIQHIGLPKTEALKEQLLEINPYMEIETHFIKMDEGNAAPLLEGADVICEAFDSPEAKSMLVDVVLSKLPEKYLVAASGMAGYESSNTIQTERVTDHFYLCGDKVSGIEQGMSLMAPRVAVCAAHEANMIVRILLERKEV